MLKSIIVLPRCRRCNALLIGPQDILGALFPVMLLIALAVTAYGFFSDDVTMLVIGLATASQVALMIGTLIVLSRTAGVRLSPAGFHPFCFELCMLDLECAEIDLLRKEAVEKRQRYDLLVARLVGREPLLAAEFGRAIGRGSDLRGEIAALDERTEIAERYHRRLDIAEIAIAAGDMGRAIKQYEAMGLDPVVPDGDVKGRPRGLCGAISMRMKEH